MEKYVLLVLLIGAIFLPLGCSKQEPARTTPVAVEAVVEEPETPAAGSAYPLRVGMWLYTIDADTGAQTDLTKAVEPVSLGERLELLTTEPRKATNPYDNRVYDYHQVRCETGKEGLVFATQLSLGGALAVVADEKAYLYRGPRAIDATDYILPRRIVVGLYPETERDGFVQIEAYDPAIQTYRRNLYIKTAALSYSDMDVQASILLQTAEALDADREKNRWEALLSSALSDYPSSIFANDIRALFGGSAGIPLRTVDLFFGVIGDDVASTKAQTPHRR
jgi:hypothetical protein